MPIFVVYIFEALLVERSFLENTCKKLNNHGRSLVNDMLLVGGINMDLY